MHSTMPAAWGDRYSAKSLHMAERGLTSVDGAKKVIEELSKRDAVAWLILRHNDLGDDGCAELFKYLCSEEGQKHIVSGILLNTNGLRNVALESIGSFLRDNRWLKELYLAGNDFIGDSSVITSFTEALNSSSLRVLSLTGCKDLSDAFAERFFPRLDSLHLSNLQLSTIGLTRTAATCIAEYLSSSRSRHLLTLKLNGSDLSRRGAAKITQSVVQANFNITCLEMYGVRAHQDGEGNSSEEGSSSGGGKEDLQCALARNEVLQRQTNAAALRLLQYSRALLLKPRPTNEGETSRPLFHIQSLPTELQLNILSLTVDTLSANQRIRIFQFASDPTTLPTILPDLWRRQSEGIPETSLLEKSSAPFTLSPRDANRARWLRAVGCDLYEHR